MDHIERFSPGRMAGFVPKVSPKVRWLDPPVVVGGRAVRLSEV